MNYFDQKNIVARLQTGVATNVAASFLKREEETILHLISQDLVNPNAFLREKKTKFGLQNLLEPQPVTRKGKGLFGIPEGAEPVS